MRQPLKDMFKQNAYEYDLQFDWTVHAAALEKKSTYLHLMGRQQQLERRHSARKLFDTHGEAKKEAPVRRTSTNQLKLPLKEECSMAVNYSTAYGPDGILLKRESSGNAQSPNVMSPQKTDLVVPARDGEMRIAEVPKVKKSFCCCIF